MKKLITLLLLVIMMPSALAFSSTALTWEDDTTEIKTVNLGDELTFKADIISYDAPVETKIKLRDQNGNILWTYVNENIASIPGDEYLSWSKQLTILEDHYDNVGQYKITFYILDGDWESQYKELNFIATQSVKPIHAIATATPLNGEAPLEVSFGCTVEGGLPPYNFLWDFGDGNEQANAAANHIYSEVGNYFAVCQVTDKDGGEDTDAVMIEVKKPVVINDEPIADFGINPNPALTNELVTFDGTFSIDPNGDDLTYKWDIGNDGTIDAMGPIFKRSFSLVKNYPIRLIVSDGEYTDDIVKTLHVEQRNRAPVASFTIDPNPVYVWTEVEFDATESYDIDGDNLKYAWYLDGQVTSHTEAKWTLRTPRFPRNITVKLVVNDGELKDYETKILKVVNRPPPENFMPVAKFTINPNPVYVGEKTVLDGRASYDPEGEPLTYKWDVENDGSVEFTNPVIAISFDTIGEHPVRLTVNDGELDGWRYEYVTVIEKPELEITKLRCFDKVIVGNEQVCDIFVESDGEKISDAKVNLYKTDGTYLGKCITNNLSGGCNIDFIENDLGTFTVYAKAYKQGFTPDVDKYPKFTYEVLPNTLVIEDLKVYEDENFSIPEDTFYRGEDLYVTFEVKDLLGNPFIPNITKTTLVSMPGGRAELREVMSNGNSFYFKLQEIPLTHEFFGDSQVFSFAFGNNGGAQASADVTILNNVPTTTGIPDRTILEGTTIRLNLDKYFDDLEGDRLKYKVFSRVPNPADWDFEAPNELTIIGMEEGTAYFSVIAFDLDKDFVESTFTVTVKPKIIENIVPNAEFEWAPQYPVEGQKVEFDGSASYDEDGEIVLYEWDFTNDGITDSTGTQERWTFVDDGTYPVKLTVTDNDGAKDWIRHEITVIEGENLPPTAVLEGKNSTEVNETVRFDASGSTDPEGGVLRFIWRIAGQIVKDSFESFLDWVFVETGDYDVEVEVVDEEGLSDTESIQTNVWEEEEPEPEPEPEPEEKEHNEAASFQKITIMGDEESVVKAGNYLHVTVRIKSEDVDNARMSLIAPELGLKSKGTMTDIDGRETMKATLWIPRSTPPGWYTLRIGMTSDDNVRKGEYRWFRITE